MAHFPIFRFSALAVLCGLLLNSCCANNVCECNDAQADAIQLRFSTDTTRGARGFIASELDTVIIQRYPKIFTNNTVPQSVTLVRTGAQISQPIELNNTTPFTQTGTDKLNQYRYVVRYLAPVRNSKPLATTVLTIDSVLLRGTFEGTGCCTCYSNTDKVVYLNGAARNIKADPVLTITK
jgi:hypothetical protein